MTEDVKERMYLWCNAMVDAVEVIVNLLTELSVEVSSGEYEAIKQELVLDVIDQWEPKLND